MNRGIAKRMMFERREDIDIFLDEVGESTARGEIDVHAYCVMGTHYHMLVRSPGGELATAMQRVQTEYSRWFNRSRRRDGPLVRGRYAARLVDSLRYRRVVVSYIDRNPITAGIVAHAADYPHGSARAYSGIGPSRTWLNRTWIESCVRGDLGLDRYVPEQYGRVFGGLPDALSRVVEARWSSRAVEDPLDDLVASSSDRIVQWMRRKAKLADATAPGVPLVDAAALEEAIRHVADRSDPSWRVGKQDGWELIRLGLGRELRGESLEVLGAQVGKSVATVSKACRQHRRLLENDDYAQRVAHVAERALAIWITK